MFSRAHYLMNISYDLVLKNELTMFTLALPPTLILILLSTTISYSSVFKCHTVYGSFSFCSDQALRYFRHAKGVKLPSKNISAQSVDLKAHTHQLMTELSFFGAFYWQISDRLFKLFKYLQPSSSISDLMSFL